LAIRLYHLAGELNLRGSELLERLKSRGLDLGSVMAVLDEEATQKARRVALGEEQIARPAAPGDSLEIKLPPPLVPAPARQLRAPAPTRAGGRRTPGSAAGTGPATSPGTRTPSPGGANTGVPQQPQRRGIRIFRQKESRERRTADKARAEEMLSGRTLAITVPISLKDFSQQIGVKTNQLLLHLMRQKIVANPNTTLDEETVLVLAEAFNRTIEIQNARSVEEELAELLDTGDSEEADGGTTRPPVVAVLGHVDHGKTSLLDRIRKTRVAAGEAGGITQHIGAYGVKLPGDRRITFLDTPGHEAFTAMRARGAKITDIVILLVAADDGVMPQTEEALNHARAAGVPIIVAMNKCDKPEANPERVKQQLSALNLAPEEWGGTTGMIPVSATTGEGIPALLDRIALDAEMLDLTASPDRPAEGFVVESRKAVGRGIVATLLVKNGTLHRGDFILCGSCQGRVKALTDDRGKAVKSAPPSMAVEVTGLDEVPEAGWPFQVVRDKDLAKKVASERSTRQREKVLAQKAHSSFEKLMDRLGSQDVGELRIVLKADVKGSIEAIRGKLEELGTDEVKIKILHTAVGGITESDVLLAEASRALVIGFHVLPDAKARALAEEHRVQVRTYQIIYELLDDITKGLQGLLPTESHEVVIGHAEIRKIFLYKKSKIGGCMVTDGVARRSARLRLSRDGRVVVNNGALESLRRFTDDVKEVKEGFDCGLRIANYDDIKEGDVLEFYEIEEKQRSL